MFKDLHLSKDLMRAYHETLQPGDSALKLNVTVLQRSAWPFTAPKNVVDLPPEMREDLDRFTRYYKSKHSGRVLEWDHALGTAVLKTRFKAGVKDLSLNLHQALVLLQFNDEDEIPFQDLKERLRMGTFYSIVHPLYWSQHGVHLQRTQSSGGHYKVSHAARRKF